VATWIRLTIYCASIILLTGCAGTKPITPMPPLPPTITHQRGPVIAYDARSKTYTVTAEMVEQATIDRIYVKEVGIWRRENGIR